MGELNPDAIERHFIIEDTAKKLHLKKEHKKTYLMIAIVCSAIVIIGSTLAICLL
jgi:hypothetical protein